MSKRAKASLFAASRIKKIMQEDEEVGKVSAGVPIAVSKALELFIRDLVVDASAKAQEKGAKKLSPYHVKRAVLDKPAYAFVKSLVEDIADPVEADEGDKPKRKRKAKEPAADGEGAAPVAKKPRKKKASAEPTADAVTEAPAAAVDDADDDDAFEAVEPAPAVVDAAEDRQAVDVDEDYD